ncbi:MAG TPA: BON domain-containing protein [Thermoanaerobaculia bacterium]|nr:BON domain-containing protein [Thermoanaerobaculia bacterium]
MSGKISRLIAAVAAAVAVTLAAACAQSDAGITTKVKAKLAADSTVKASDINVDTKDRVVTLSGKVDSEAAKARAVELARATDGVSNVVDNLTWTSAQVSENTSNPPGVPPAATGEQPGMSGQAGAPSNQPVTDAAITAAVKSKLLADTTVGGLKINVDTKDGVVSLSGPVKSQAEKDTAVRIARETSGVRDVQDNLVVQTG